MMAKSFYKDIKIVTKGRIIAFCHALRYVSTIPVK